jgi:glycine cleavage system H protein
VTPDDLRYTAEHEWCLEPASGAGGVRVGITHFAQESLGDIVFVQLPDPGTEVTAGEPLGEVESTKSVSEIYAPITGRVVARNDDLENDPGVIKHRPVRRPAG